jgi:hypothetical protein
MAVYFIRGERSGNVKIGYTSGDIEKRLGNLLTSSSEELFLVKSIPNGTLKDEKRLHKRFERSHLTREWFRYQPEISIYLGDLTDFDKMNLFRIRIFEDQDQVKACSGFIVLWLSALAELAYYKGKNGVPDFLAEYKTAADMGRPLDDPEIRYLTSKRWGLYAEKNG